MAERKSNKKEFAVVRVMYVNLSIDFEDETLVSIEKDKFNLFCSQLFDEVRNELNRDRKSKLKFRTIVNKEHSFMVESEDNLIHLSACIEDIATIESDADEKGRYTKDALLNELIRVCY